MHESASTESSTSSISKALSSPHKRKRRIEDFFPSKRLATLPGPALPLQERCISHSLIPGLTIREDFIMPSEEQSLLSFLYTSPKCIWRTDLSRRCMHFGGTYCLYTSPTPSNGMQKAMQPKPEVLQAPPMPDELSWLMKRFVSQSVFREDQIPQYCIVNEYREAQGISAHVENYSFGESVVGLSLLSPVAMRFHELAKLDGGSVRSGKAAKAEKTGRKEDIELPGRSLCVMRGESRWKWQHEILRSKKGRPPGWTRVSLTFRWKDEKCEKL